MQVLTIRDFFDFVIIFFQSSIMTFNDVFRWFTTPFKVLGIVFDYTPLELMFSTGLIAFLLAVIVQWVINIFWF